MEDIENIETNSFINKFLKFAKTEKLLINNYNYESGYSAKKHSLRRAVSGTRLYICSDFKSFSTTLFKED